MLRSWVNNRQGSGLGSQFEVRLPLNPNGTKAPSQTSPWNLAPPVQTKHTYCLVPLLPLTYLSVLYTNFHGSNYLLLVYACVLPLALVLGYAARTNRARGKLVYLVGSAQVYHFLSQISLAKLRHLKWSLYT